MQERLGVMAEDLYTTKIMDATVAERRPATVPHCPLGWARSRRQRWGSVERCSHNSNERPDNGPCIASSWDALACLCCLCILRPTVWAARFATEKQEWLAVCESSYKQFQGVQVTVPAEASFLPQPTLTRSLSGRDLLRS